MRKERAVVEAGRQSMGAGAILLAVSVAACADQPRASIAGFTVGDSAGIAIAVNNGPAPATVRLDIEPLLTIGDDLPVEQSPLDPTAVFSDASGRILVGDGNQVGWRAVLVYDTDGSFQMKMGGPGRGPGEFGGQLWWAGPYRADSVVAWDRRGPSVKVFGPDGGYSRDVMFPRVGRQPPKGTFAFSPGFHGAFRDGSLLISSEGAVETPPEAGPAWYQHYLLAVEPGGAGWDTIAYRGLVQSYWDGQKQATYLYGATASILPYGDDLIIGNSQTYEYRVLGRDGQLRQIVRRSWAPEPVEASDIEAVVTRFLESARSRGATADQLAQTRRNVEGYPHAAVKPAYSSILVGSEGRVWVERYRWFDPWSLPPDPGPTTWDVFSSAGEWVCEVVVPARVVVLSVSNGRVFGVQIDETDVRHIVVFALPAMQSRLTMQRTGQRTVVPDRERVASPGTRLPRRTASGS